MTETLTAHQEGVPNPLAVMYCNWPNSEMNITNFCRSVNVDEGWAEMFPATQNAEGKALLILADPPTFRIKGTVRIVWPANVSDEVIKRFGGEREKN